MFTAISTTKNYTTTIVTTTMVDIPVFVIAPEILLIMIIIIIIRKLMCKTQIRRLWGRERLWGRRGGVEFCSSFITVSHNSGWTMLKNVC